jgi:hypothetical protein
MAVLVTAISDRLAMLSSGCPGQARHDEGRLFQPDPARLMTSPHFRESAAISAANSSGVPLAGSSPIVA